MSRRLLTKEEIPRDARQVQALRRELQRNTQLISQAFWQEFEQIRNSQRNQLAAETANRERLTEIMNETNLEAQRQIDALSRSISSHGINPLAPSPVMRRELPAPPTSRKDAQLQQLLQQLPQKKQRQKKRPEPQEKQQEKQPEKQPEKETEKQQEGESQKEQVKQPEKQSEKEPEKKNLKKQTAGAKPPLMARTNAQPPTKSSQPRAEHTKHLTNLSTPKMGSFSSSVLPRFQAGVSKPNTSSTPSRKTAAKSKLGVTQKAKK